MVNLGGLVEPKFVRPELLRHPNIPQPLHGVNPRSIFGPDWWEMRRRLAYTGNNYCCWACGVHQSMDPYKPWLEAHETYDIDFKAGRSVFTDVVALCHSCHNFIHSGRLVQLLVSGVEPRDKVFQILTHGLYTLRTNDLTPFAGTHEILIKVDQYCGLWSIQMPADLRDEYHQLTTNVTYMTEVFKWSMSSIAAWSTWRLVLPGTPPLEFPPKWGSLSEAQRHYRSLPAE